MIVKVERYKGGNSFILVDNIWQIHRFNGWKDAPLRIGDIVIKDHYESLPEDAGFTPDYPYMIKLQCEKGDGSEINIIFDTVAYILNDQGKTIEKALANERYNNIGEPRQVGDLLINERVGSKPE